MSGNIMLLFMKKLLLAAVLPIVYLLFNDLNYVYVHLNEFNGLDFETHLIFWVSLVYSSVVFVTYVISLAEIPKQKVLIAIGIYGIHLFFGLLLSLMYKPWIKSVSYDGLWLNQTTLIGCILVCAYLAVNIWSWNRVKSNKTL